MSASFQGDPPGATLLGLKSALFDRNTGLCAFPFHFGELLRMVERRPLLGVLHVALSDSARIEWICGWQTFDRILERMAEDLKALRGSGYAGSGLLALTGVHGAGFVLFLPETLRGDPPATTDLEEVAGRLRRSLSLSVSEAFPLDAGREVEVRVGASLLRCEPLFRIERLVYRAVEEARASGSISAGREEQRSGAELRAIIRAELVETHFQPIVDVASGTVFGYEALTRGPRGTIFENPGALFGCSDRMRISPMLDAVCSRRALSAARGLPAGLKLFVNALPASLSDPRFGEAPEADLGNDGRVPPESVVLEITERSGIEDFETFGRRLERLRERGFQVAIDDVGTGYSSLQTISEVRPEFLKIDLSLVKNIHQSLIKQEIVGTILQIGERIGSRVIAEGIESDEEFRTLKGFGVRLGQGFLLGAPTPNLPRSGSGPLRGH